MATDVHTSGDGNIANDNSGGRTTGNKRKKRKIESLATTYDHYQQQLLSANDAGYHDVPSIPITPGHLRLGWAMRTAELQAPVGYDKWGYALRSIGGSRVHDSKREDHWGGGSSFGPGDVIGLLICLVDGQNRADVIATDGDGGINDRRNGGTRNNKKVNYRNKRGGGKNKGDGTISNSSNSNVGNHIRAFLNGEPMGHFIVSRGVRHGGELFTDIRPGTYYPALSSYLGGKCRANMGPHFVYPPRSKSLPGGVHSIGIGAAVTGSRVRKVVDSSIFVSQDEDEEKDGSSKDRGFVSWGVVFEEAVRIEANVRRLCWEDRMARHVEEVKTERNRRSLSTKDLPSRDETRTRKDDQGELIM